MKPAFNHPPRVGKELAQKRERSDKTQKVERKTQDHARAQERFQKRSIVESMKVVLKFQ
jgi:hypothetical protein